MKDEKRLYVYGEEHLVRTFYNTLWKLGLVDTRKVKVNTYTCGDGKDMRWYFVVSEDEE